MEEQELMVHAPCLPEAGQGDKPLLAQPQVLFEAYAGKLTRLKSLLKAGANPNAAGVGNMTALHWAAARGETACLECLVEKRASLNARDAKGRTALHFAKFFGRHGAESALNVRTS